VDDAVLSGEGWVRGADPLAYEGTTSTASVAGARLRVRVRAKRVSLVAMTGPGGGTVEVFDGSRKIRTIRLASSVVRRRVLLSVVTYPDVGVRDLSVVVASAGRAVTIDGLAWRSS
jgi:hypothetical protein